MDFPVPDESGSEISKIHFQTHSESRIPKILFEIAVTICYLLWSKIRVRCHLWLLSYKLIYLTGPPMTPRKLAESSSQWLWKNIVFKTCLLGFTLSFLDQFKAFVTYNLEVFQRNLKLVPRIIPDDCSINKFFNLLNLKIVWKKYLNLNDLIKKRFQNLLIYFIFNG